jgi:hypothetical protein
MAAPHRISRRTAVRAASSALVTGAALTAGIGASTRDAAARASSLVGTWVVTSTRGAAVPNGILVIILPDGSFLRTGNSHPTESPGMGVWRQVSDGVYETTYLALAFDNAGTVIGHRKSWQRITLDPSGDSFTGETRGATLDLNGAETARTEGMIRGSRMVVEPFA